MRTLFVLLSFGSLLCACGREPEPTSGSAEAPPGTAEPAAPAPQAAPAPAPTIAAAPHMGGAVVATGDFAVEVVANASGSVDAAVTTAGGDAVTHGDVASLVVTAQGEGSVRQEIALAFDAPRGVFHGVAKGGARLASGPLDVACSIRGKALTGHLDMLVALPRAQFGGRMLALGRFAAELVPKVDGSVDVHLSDAAGALLTADGGLALQLRAVGKTAATQAIALRWDAPRTCFTGKAEAAAELAGAAFELSARAAGDVDLAGRIEAVALVAPPSIGGSMIAAADYTVEIAPQVDGQIDAIVRGSAGATVEGGVDLEARVQAGGELRPVKLTWDPARLRFRGKLEGGLELEPGPIELSLVADGKLRAGAIMAAAVVPKIDADVDAHLHGKANAHAKLDAKAKARLPLASGKASGSAKLAVDVPKPSASAKGSAAANASGSVKAGANGSTAAKASAKQQAGVKLGGSLSSGISIGTK